MREAKGGAAKACRLLRCGIGKSPDDLFCKARLKFPPVDGKMEEFVHPDCGMDSATIVGVWWWESILRIAVHSFFF